MALRRIRILVDNTNGAPVYKRVSGDSDTELADNIVREYVRTGRINEFLEHVRVVPEKTVPLLKDYAAEWLKLKEKQVKRTTYVHYEQELKLYIIPSLGMKYLDEIGMEDVQNMMNEMEQLSKKTIRDTKSLLSQIMEYAMSKYRCIEINPCKNRYLCNPSERVMIREALPIEYFRDILDHLTCLDQMDRYFLGLVMYTTLRKGEALGLQWEDLNPENGLINVRRTVSHPKQNQPVITTPKTKAGYRQVPLDPDLVKLLHPDGRTGYIIQHEGEPISARTYSNMMDRIRRTIDLHGATAHILRHSYITYASSLTTDYKTLQGIAGHADITMTVNGNTLEAGSLIYVLAESDDSLLVCVPDGEMKWRMGSGTVIQVDKSDVIWAPTLLQLKYKKFD